jgi:ADP-ribose pyrophosphatase YjhB (NUDIX family)
MSKDTITCQRFSGGTIEIAREKIIERVSVYAILLTANRGILLMELSTGKFFPPGGGKEPWETFEEALRREVREEVGCEIKNLVKFNVEENFFCIDELDVAYHATAIFYRAEVATAELPNPVARPEEFIRGWRIFSIGEIEMDPSILQVPFVYPCLKVAVSSLRKECYRFAAEARKHTV